MTVIRYRFIFSALLFKAILNPIGSFVMPTTRLGQHQPALPRDLQRLGATAQSDVVDRLIDAIDATKNEKAEGVNGSVVTELLDNLEEQSTTSDDPNRFDPLLGLYDVSHVEKAKEQDNPVGGKWTRKTGLAQKILRTRRTFQHLLTTNTTGLCNPNLGAVVAEAVNVISLDALWGLIRLTIILRGDAVPLENKERLGNKIPLTNLAVRAFFDPPRIVFGKTGRFVNLNLGPTSSVVLDSTYIDHRVRIGKGGTSGTRFVFLKCDNDDKEAMEFKSLLERKPTKKSRIFAFFGAIAASSLFRAVKQPSFRVTGALIASVASLLCLGLTMSTGGIEKDDVSYTKGISNSKV